MPTFSNSRRTRSGRKPETSEKNKSESKGKEIEIQVEEKNSLMK